MQAIMERTGCHIDTLYGRQCYDESSLGSTKVRQTRIKVVGPPLRLTMLLGKRL